MRYLLEAALVLAMVSAPSSLDLLKDNETASAGTTKSPTKEEQAVTTDATAPKPTNEEQNGGGAAPRFSLPVLHTNWLATLAVDGWNWNSMSWFPPFATTWAWILWGSLVGLPILIALVIGIAIASRNGNEVGAICLAPFVVAMFDVAVMQFGPFVANLVWLFVLRYIIWFLLAIVVLIVWVAEFFFGAFIFPVQTLAHHFHQTHTESVTSGVPLFLGVPLSVAIALVPTIMMFRARAHISLKLEIVTSSADFASDLLWCFKGHFWDATLLVVAWLITFASGFTTVVILFGLDILYHWGLFLVVLPVNRLAEHDIHQVFDEHRDSPEMLMVNVLATLFLVFSVLVMPLIAIIACLIITLYGVILQSMRLLSLLPITRHYGSLCLRWTQETGEGDAEDVPQGVPVNAVAYHTGIVVELVMEAIPAISLNGFNLHLLCRDGVAKGVLVVWPGILALVLSGYMTWRFAYKYGYHLFYMSRSLSDVPIPTMTDDNDSMTSHPREAAGAAGAVAAVGVEALRSGGTA